MEPFGPIVPNVPPSPSFAEDERDLLDAEDWDDLDLAEWLALPSWASEVEDDPLYP